MLSLLDTSHAQSCMHIFLCRKMSCPLIYLRCGILQMILVSSTYCGFILEGVVFTVGSVMKK